MRWLISISPSWPLPCWRQGKYHHRHVPGHSARHADGAAQLTIVDKNRQEPCPQPVLVRDCRDCTPAELPTAHAAVRIATLPYSGGAISNDPAQSPYSFVIAGTAWQPSYLPLMLG